MNNILGIISVAATSFAVGVFVYSLFIFEKPTPDNMIELGNLKKDTSKVLVTDSFIIKKLVINLKSPATKLRYLDVTIHLVPFKADRLELIEKHKAFIQDSIIKIVGDMTPVELNSIAGKIILEDRIKKSINKSLGFSLIKKLFFTQFIIQ